MLCSGTPSHVGIRHTSVNYTLKANLKYLKCVLRHALKASSDTFHRNGPAGEKARRPQRTKLYCGSGTVLRE